MTTFFIFTCFGGAHCHQRSRPKGLRLQVVCKLVCPGCNASSVGETSRHFSTRVLEHFRTINLEVLLVLILNLFVTFVDGRARLPLAHCYWNQSSRFSRLTLRIETSQDGGAQQIETVEVLIWIQAKSVLFKTFK